MSFQDFSSSNTRPRPISAPTNLGSSPNKPDALSQISESLLQYQRNVGILEKIVQSLASRNQFYNEELNIQYHAQVDVIGQLEEKVKKLLDMNNNKIVDQKTAVIKLQRDFERVQARANALQSGMERLQKENAQKAALQEETTQSTTTPVQDHYAQVQLQLQQDRLNEEIMREREEEIRTINRGMHQVNEIYKDLAHIVGSQQEHIDSIETQMEDSRANAESGLKQVEKANEKYGSSQCVIS